MTKGREIIIFAKSQPPFDVHRRFSDRFTGWSFKVSLSNFSLFCGFLENLADYHWFLFLKIYRHMIFLHLEQFENKLVD